MTLKTLIHGSRLQSAIKAVNYVNLITTVSKPSTYFESLLSFDSLPSQDRCSGWSFFAWTLHGMVCGPPVAHAAAAAAANAVFA
ncbi:unnamed protein product [Hydatigera taeniaeformis]|uniref:Secreted protein n=1 Tax=Hydatigena taeniaeformis TaxID=6205 RepID=A0A0R3X9M8_HYDTA|nr:unnamed protein product [Hydatigera taeniaeformis]